MNAKLLIGTSCLILFCLYTPSLSAQISLSGTITDQSTGEPLAFVYVIPKNNQRKGVLSNDIGEYTLSLTEEDLQDTLILSLLGYESRAIPLGALPGGSNLRLDLSMQSAFVELGEVVIKANLDPEYIAQQALKAIPKNYGVSQYMLKGYFREYGIADGEYASITEAMITIEDGYYSSPKKHSKIYLDELRHSDFHGSTPEELRSGDVNSIYNLYESFTNCARIHQLHWLWTKKHDFLEAFNFRTIGIYDWGKDTLMRIAYELDTDPKNKTANSFRFFAGWTKGEVLVNLSDYGIMRNRRGSEKDHSYTEVSYHKYSGRYFPTRLTNIFGFEYGWDGFYVSNRVLYFTTIISDPDKMRTYSRKKLIPYKRRLEDLKYQYNEKFWKTNRIVASLSAAQALEVDLNRGKKLTDQFRDNGKRN